MVTGGKEDAERISASTDGQRGLDESGRLVGLFV